MKQWTNLARLYTYVFVYVRVCAGCGCVCGNKFFLLVSLSKIKQGLNPRNNGIKRAILYTYVCVRTLVYVCVRERAGVCAGACVCVHGCVRACLCI